MKSATAFNTGLQSARAGQRMLARIQFQQVTEADPDLAEGWLWLAWTSDTPARAMDCLQRANELSPDDPLIDAFLQVASGLDGFEFGLNVQADDSSANESETESATEVPEFNEPIAEVAETEAGEAADDENGLEDDSGDIGPKLDEFDSPVTDESTADAATSSPAECVSTSDECAEQSIASSLKEIVAEVEESIPHDAYNQGILQNREALMGACVLVVDDSPTVRKLITMTLESAGYDVVTAADGVEATRALIEMTPDMIITDIDTPRMDGYQLCKFIKRHKKTQKIPVMMLSGQDGMFGKLRGKMVGCNDYISKPFDSGDLLRLVDQHVGEGFVPSGPHAAVRVRISD